MMREEKIFYFDYYKEEENTEKLLDLVKDFCDRKGIKDIVIASTRGLTARLAMERFPSDKYNVVIVTHVCWFRGYKQEFDENLRGELEKKGYKVLTAAHAMSGIGRAVSSKFGGITPGSIIASTLRLFCEGMKVAVEIACMATDAGYIPIDRDVVAIAGTGRGADTAILITPKTSRNFFDIKIKEIIAKPVYKE